MRIIFFTVLVLISNTLWAQDADISVGVNLFQSRVITGDLAKMQITIRNQGPNDASGVALTLM